MLDEKAKKALDYLVNSGYSFEEVEAAWKEMKSKKETVKGIECEKEEVVFNYCDGIVCVEDLKSESIKVVERVDLKTESRAIEEWWQKIMDGEGDVT